MNEEAISVRQSVGDDTRGGQRRRLQRQRVPRLSPFHARSTAGPAQPPPPLSKHRSPGCRPPPPTPTPPPLSKPCSAQLTRLRLATRFRPLESDAKCAVMRAKEASKYRTERPTMPDDKCGGRWVGGWVCCGGWRGPPCLMIRVLLWR